MYNVIDNFYRWQWYSLSFNIASYLTTILQVSAVISFFLDNLFAPIDFLMSPQKRIYWLYLVTSVLLLVVFQYRVRGKIKGFTSDVWSKSSGVDLCWLVVNQVLLKLWIAPFFALQLSAIIWLNGQFVALFGSGNFFKLNAVFLTLLFAFTLFIVNDFAKFLVHRSFHKIPWLWPFHAVHHSATSLTPLTLYRIHPVEFTINSLRSFMVAVLISSCFVYLFANRISVLQIIGVNVFVFAFNLAGSNLRHSRFYLGFGWLERYFISPAQHQIHHSVKRQHFDKNFGSALAIWDRLFNSLLLSKAQQVDRFGLDNGPTNRQTLGQQWWGVRGR